MRIRRSPRLWLVLVLLLSVSRPSQAQQRLLTIDDIYDPETRVNFSGTLPAGLEWIDDTRLVWSRSEGDGVGWFAVDAASGSERPLFDAARMQAALERVGVAPEEARGAARSRDLSFDGRYAEALAVIADDLYLYEFVSDRAVRLTNTPEIEEHVAFSPDGQSVAFVRGHNLFAVDVATGRERALTSDGAPRILNGKLDWVYEEEIYGRGLNRAYWWSPDSSAIAFLRIDDRPVPRFSVVDDIPYDQTVEQWDYPQAGDPNPLVTLAVVQVAEGAARTIDTNQYPPEDRLIVAVSWTPDSRQVVYLVQNRVQSFVDMLAADLATLSSRTLVHETSKHFIDPDDAKPPIWLKDGSFLWLSARSGWKHLYRFDAGGTLVKQITSGAWELRTLHGIDESAGRVYFSGTERSHIGGDVYRVQLDGTGLQRISAQPGTHAATFNRAFTHYVDTWSDVSTPPQMRLHRSDGTEVRTLAENRVEAFSAYKLGPPEFLQVTTRDGFPMEAMMIKPPGFDPARRYPVYQFTYGGPHSPRVLNAWRGSEFMYHQLLAQRDIIVWICDNRTASGKGAESVWPLFRRFGDVEMRDIEDGIAWLKRQTYVDAARIGMHGWSYGGYLTSYALTHSTSFVMGIAGGTVSDWRNYDSIYTERYLGLPDENAAGYRDSSPRWFAKDLHGALLLLHGAIDDNVHVANTMQFAYELQKAQKPFEMMLYPKSRHGVTEPLLAKHLRETMLAFTLRYLTPPAGSDGTSAGHR
ncbi:MAG: prolyl oligopeptidase family serine peptidase [Luteitalea sp.]|nr:prolyl oligopeptidase family serine peptidase [Luteitalea sp.]